MNSTVKHRPLAQPSHIVKCSLPNIFFWSFWRKLSPYCRVIETDTETNRQRFYHTFTHVFRPTPDYCDSGSRLRLSDDILVSSAS